MKLLVLNGPNLNLLGLREPDIYGSRTYADLENFLSAAAKDAACEIDMQQSNHEGTLVDWIQGASGRYDGIIINPAAYTHTSIAILDALKAVALPAVEVHLSDVSTREPFRRISYTSQACICTIKGEGFDGYRRAVFLLRDRLEDTQANAT